MSDDGLSRAARLVCRAMAAGLSFDEALRAEAPDGQTEAVRKAVMALGYVKDFKLTAKGRAAGNGGAPVT